MRRIRPSPRPSAGRRRSNCGAGLSGRRKNRAASCPGLVVFYRISRLVVARALYLRRGFDLRVDLILKAPSLRPELPLLTCGQITGRQGVVDFLQSLECVSERPSPRQRLLFEPRAFVGKSVVDSIAQSPLAVSVLICDFCFLPKPASVLRVCPQEVAASVVLLLQRRAKISFSLLRDPIEGLAEVAECECGNFELLYFFVYGREPSFGATPCEKVWRIQVARELRSLRLENSKSPCYLPFWEP